MAYLINLFSLLLVSITYIGIYYKWWLHKEVFDWSYSPYFISIIVIYAIYKFIQFNFWGKKVKFSPLSILWYFVLNLSILSIVYFNIIEKSGGMVLFFKIIWYLLLPFFIITISLWASNKILNKIKSFKSEDSIFKFLISLGFAFVLFMTPLVIFWSIWFYNLWTVFGILTVFLIYSFKEIADIFVSLYTKKFELDNHKINWDFYEQINLNLITTELLFIFITFIVWINFINAVRPMPIGWDDLGVYMNYPKIFAANWQILSWIWMTARQSLTGIGYMFNSATQAFFLNQIGWVMSVIVIILALTSLLKTSKKTFINLPFLASAIFISMPMVIFEQAKDMKLDPGLFFVSAIWIYAIFYLFLKYLWYESELVEETENLDYKEEWAWIFSLVFSKIKSVFKSESWDSWLFDNRDYLVLIWVIWMIVWLAFTIKFTTLMLILGLIWVIFYAKLGFSGFLGYFFLFISLFTKLKLWNHLNVNYPKDDVNFINYVSIIGFIISVALFIYTFKKYKLDSFKKAFLINLVFIIWIGITAMPWLVKNMIEVYPNISIWWILGWKTVSNFSDYSKIYSSEELAKIENKDKQLQAISSSGKTTNEDLWRYFGYENWINNYLKLPFNLTLQRNQNWEYTEIWYIFLALIPIVFLFLNFKNVAWSFVIFGGVILEYLYFIIPGTSEKLTAFFATQNLPIWYIWIALAFLIPLGYFLYSLKNDKPSQVFKLNLVFNTMYSFIFVIAAYGIVWYWISMYFSFLLMISVAGYYISSEDSNPEYNSIKFLWALILFVIVSVYFVNSGVPHGFSNLKAAGFSEFKAWLVNQEEWIFGSHPDYFSIVATLNINDQNKLITTNLASIKNEVLKKIITENIWTKPSLDKLESLLREVINTDLTKMWADYNTQLTIKTEAKNTLKKMYLEVLNPPKDNQNSGWIYRIWTFLTYFISNNRDRYYDDSLVSNFDKYFYNENPDVTVDRMKKMGLNYFLVDLNAATIDKDPRHDLTRRFENLLKTFKSSKLELIQTDSLCLRIALEEKNENYMTMAWVNYESYTGSWETINRGQKQLACYNHILDLLKDKKISKDKYSYLLPLENYINKTQPKSQDEILQIFQNYVSHGWLALFKIK
ncbi:MAG: hypothetical protein ACD_49C00068G0017 [uncultured bacterium (gcode 4)]|uniref:Uncharacterized protein n=1 Tax=uncultured bacterium (gcode 4) TaxID=1234023 RepID=K2AVZ5_9BACT|nr:MAG: hypothetical protein ACD_49C00068G0017 [uncultured bacterium (gcode 4)]